VAQGYAEASQMQPKQRKAGGEVDHRHWSAFLFFFLGNKLASFLSYFCINDKLYCGLFTVM
jgi:hypothetical protein